MGLEDASEGCIFCLRCLLTLFNVILGCAGAGIFGFALWLRYNSGYFSDLPDKEFAAFYLGCYILMAAGGMIMVVGILGCCGAVKESTCLLVVYFVVLFVIFCGEIGGSVWCYLQRDDLNTKIDVEINTWVTEKYKHDASIQLAVDNIQIYLKCCGASGPEDYPNSGQVAPESCGKNCTVTKCEEDEGIREVGCKDKLARLVEQNLMVLAGICIAVALAQILAMVLAIILCRYIWLDEHYDYESCSTI